MAVIANDYTEPGDRTLWREIPSKIAKKIQSLAIARTPSSTGFRLHKQLISLVQVHALYSRRSRVGMNDFEEIRRLSKFMNIKFPKIYLHAQSRFLTIFGREGG
jgi:hypothetical protein